MICSQEKCTGCGACRNACPVDAINMELNEEGFLKPRIQSEKCINCGLCERICPSNADRTEEAVDCKSFAMYYKDDEVTRKSSSGGIFYALSKYVVEEMQGVVFGAVFDEEQQVKISSAQNEKELHPMMGSKYVYSNTGYTYRETKQFLEQNRVVLYSGLPCQIAGLLNYLQKTYNNLITVEILCHGAPSQDLFNKYLEVMEQKNGSPIKLVSQRDGSKDWNSLIQKRICVKFENGNCIQRKEDFDAYMSLFIRELSYNPTCYNCLYANEDRRADITLGDYGGLGVWEKSNSKNPNGVSYVRVNGLKALEVIEHIENIHKEERPDWEIKVMNSAIVKPTKKPIRRDEFFIDYRNLSNEELFNKYYFKDYSYKVRCLIKNMIIGMLGADFVAKLIGGNKR